MKAKQFSILLLLFFTFFLTATSADAKLLPRFRSGGKKVAPASSGIAVSAKLRKDRKAVVVSFGNLNKTKNVTYTLIYQTNGKDEGVSGSISSAGGNSATRELLFGTCSSGVCRYHAGLSNVRLEIITELNSGKKTLKRFKIKV